MKVLIFPYSDLNPYQRLLVGELKMQGVEISSDSTLFRLRRLFLRPDFDLLHLHWLPGDIPRVLLLLLRLSFLKIWGVPIVWTVHNLTHHMKTGWVDLFNRKVVARLASILICHCGAARELVAKTFGISGDKIVIVPHGNYIGVYPGKTSKAAARQKLGLPQKGFVFLAFGIAMRRKGLVNFVREFKKLEKPATLVYAGKMSDPLLQGELEKLQEGRDNIKYFFGFVPDKDVSMFFSAADCVVLAHEGVLTSGVAALAASFGRAAVAPRVGCVPEQLGQGEDLLYDPARKEGLLDALNRASEADLERLGRTNLEKAKKLRWGGIARKTAKVYKEALGD